MRVGIVGGGFAGLAAAIAFRQDGHDVTVFEQATGPSAIGGAIALAPNTLACLLILGVRQKVTTQPWSGMAATVRARDGRVLIRRTLAQLAGGDEFATVPRAQLIAWLAEALPPGCVRYSSNVSHVAGDGSVVVDNHTDRFDLLIGADGLRGITRELLFADASPPRATGITGWAWTVDRELATGFGPIWGSTADFGILPLVDGRTYVYGGSRRRDTDLRSFRDWPEPLPALIEAATDGEVVTPAIFEARPPRRLVRGNVALIGDAAHCMRPTFGQGAALAMEDAITLARRGVPGLSRRWPRMLALYGTSKAGSRFTAPGNAALEGARNRALQLLPDPLFAELAGSVSRWRG